MAVTETWLNNESSIVIGEITPAPIPTGPKTMVGLDYFINPHWSQTHIFMTASMVEIWTVVYGKCRENVNIATHLYFADSKC